MAASQNSSIVISEFDYQHLLSLCEKAGTPAAEALEDEMGRADIVKTLPENVVAMNSSVTFIDLDSGEETRISLVYPQDAKVDDMKISILTPVGTALIGLGVGGKIDWPTPGGKVRRLQVTAVSPAPSPEKMQ
ncbi:MAG TPA: nucleoside diphosphate kinase regulator [Cellvibrio sp.]|nr:nucleoside diphosphate kinase regulator [Cellvibrio sp.]